MAKKEKEKVKMRIKKGDRVVIITGKDKGKQGKVLVVDRSKNRLIVEGANMLTKHKKPGRENQKGGIMHQEGFIHASNVMYLHNGKPTRIGYTFTQDGDKKVKHRVAKITGDTID